VMRLEIEVWLRGNDFATTEVVDVAVRQPQSWTDDDVRTLLQELLRAIDRVKHPDADRARPVALRGFSWIVSPYDGGGYTVAVEIQLGASAAGPFDVNQAELEEAIRRVLGSERAEVTNRQSVH
jgi:hypothetical protein